MCIPYIEHSPPRKTTSKKKPTRKGHRGNVPNPICRPHPDYGGYRAMRKIFHGAGPELNPLVFRPPDLGQIPWHGGHQRQPQWSPFNQIATGYGLHPSYRQPYIPEPQMIYSMPQERRDFSRISWADQPLKHPGSMEVYRPNGREDRHHVNEPKPVVIVHTSDGRGRSRSRGGSHTHRHHTRGVPRYYDRRRDSSSVDSSLYEYRRPRYRRSHSM